MTIKGIEAKPLFQLILVLNWVKYIFSVSINNATRNGDFAHVHAGWQKYQKMPIHTLGAQLTNNC